MTEKTSNQHVDKIVVEPDAEVTNQTRNQRRALMASIVAAGAVGLPTQWKKPVIDHILLPAHAQMSPDPSSTFTTQVTTSFSVAQSATGNFTCSNDTLRDQIITSAISTVGLFTISYIVTDILRETCQDPVGGTTSSEISNFSYTTVNTATVFPTITSFTTLITSPTSFDSGSYTFTSSISGTTTVTSSA